MEKYRCRCRIFQKSCRECDKAERKRQSGELGNMDGITARQALEAYNILMNYCSMQGNCENCLLSMGEDNDCGDCIMEIQSEPRGWQELDLD